MPSYQDLMQTVKEKLDAQAAVFDKIDEELTKGRESAEPTAEEREQLKTLMQAADAAEASAVQMKEAEGMRAAITARQEQMKEIDRKFSGNMSRQDVEKQSLDFGRQVQQVKSIGQQFMDDPKWKAWIAEHRTGDNFRTGKFGQSPPVEVKTLLTGLSSTSAGALVVNERKPLIDMGTFYRPLTIMDLLTMGQTDSDTVEYVRQGTHTNNAAPVAEATATGDGSGAKPESAMALSVVTETVKTIAHWIPATRRALADASQLRTLIESFLRYGLDEEFEDQIMNGSGSGENFTGIHNTSGITAQAWDTNILTTTRKARTKVRVTGRANPNGYVLHPTDWETIDLLQDNEARYYFGGPTQLGSPRLWGLPVVESEAETQGQGLCADFRLAAVWMRMQAAIYVSDSHGDFFVRNLIAILAEERAAFGVIRPAAFVEIDLTA